MSTTSQPIDSMPSMTASWISGAIVRMSRPTTRRLAERNCTIAAPIANAVLASIWSG
jgi:cytosine/adenosine deaminase-related metal-dependent hydrolase